MYYNSNSLFLILYYLFLLTYYLFLITYSLLLITYSSLLITYSLLLITHYSLLITYYLLLITPEIILPPQFILNTFTTTGNSLSVFFTTPLTTIMTVGFRHPYNIGEISIFHDCTRALPSIIIRRMQATAG